MAGKVQSYYNEKLKGDYDEDTDINKHTACQLIEAIYFGDVKHGRDMFATWYHLEVNGGIR